MEINKEEIKFFSESEVCELKTRWWDHIQPSCQENISLITENNSRYEKYIAYLKIINDLKSGEFKTYVSLVFKDDSGVLARKINAAIEEILNSDESFCYSDNFRVASPENEDSIKIYQAIQSEGCCGFYDDIIEIEKKEVMIGFNYGH